MYLRVFFFLLLPLVPLFSSFAEDTQSAGVATIELIPWQSEEGVIRFERSKHKTDFFQLANHFESQSNKIYCGVASSAIILNALRLGKEDIVLPKDESLLSKDKRRYLPPRLDPIFRRYTQQNLFNKEAKTELQVLGQPLKIGSDIQTDYGIQIRQLHALLASHGLDVLLRVVADDLSEDAVKAELITNLTTKDDYVLVNYTRKALGQKGGGHISPLAAYDKLSDSFLIMDVNPNASDWVWVFASDLIAAMRSFDTIENRGYVLVKETITQ